MHSFSDLIECVTLFPTNNCNKLHFFARKSVCSPYGYSATSGIVNVLFRSKITSPDKLLTENLFSVH